MPKIPSYTADVAPGLPVNPEAMVAPERAAARTGLAAIDVGEVLARRQAEMQEDIDNKVALDTFGKYSTDVANRRVEMSKVKGQSAMQTNEDGSFKLVTDTEKWHNDKAKSYSQGLYNDTQRDKFGRLVAGEKHSDLNWTASHIAQADKEYTQEVRTSWKQRVINEIAMSNGDQTYIDNRMAAYQEIAKTLKLDDSTIQRDLTEIQSHALAKQKDAQTSNEIAGFVTKHAGNIEAAMEDASSPENTVRLGKDQQDKILSSLSSRLKIQDEVYQKNYRQTADTFVQKMAAGTLTKNEIVNSNLRPDDKSKWESHLDSRNRQIRMERNQQKALDAEARRMAKEALKEAQNKVLIKTENAIRSGDLTDERQIDAIVAGAGLAHEDNTRLKKLFDDNEATKGQVNFYNQAVESMDKHFGFAKKEDRSEEETNRRNAYLSTFHHYMKQSKLKVNDPANIELMNKLLMKRDERTPGYNPFQWGVPTRMEEVLEGVGNTGTFINPEEIGMKLPKKTVR